MPLWLNCSMVSNPVGRQAADIFRGDLAEADKRGGHCAFCFELPATLLDGTAHLLHVRIAGTAVELTNSPIGFGPLAVSDLIHEISSLRAEVKRLSKAVDFAVAPNGAFQSGLLRELCDRVAAYSEIQREAIESELDALRAMTFAPKPAKQAPPARPACANRANASMADGTRIVMFSPLPKSQRDRGLLPGTAWAAIPVDRLHRRGGGWHVSGRCPPGYRNTPGE